MFKIAAHGYTFPRCCFLAENINSLRSWTPSLFDQPTILLFPKTPSIRTHGCFAAPLPLSKYVCYRRIGFCRPNTKTLCCKTLNSGKRRRSRKSIRIFEKRTRFRRVFRNPPVGRPCPRCVPECIYDSCTSRLGSSSSHLLTSTPK
jgi:hypothetical protein